MRSTLIFFNIRRELWGFWVPKGVVEFNLSILFFGGWVGYLEPEHPFYLVKFPIIRALLGYIPHPNKQTVRRCCLSLAAETWPHDPGWPIEAADPRETGAVIQKFNCPNQTYPETCPCQCSQPPRPPLSCQFSAEAQQHSQPHDTPPCFLPRYSFLLLLTKNGFFCLQLKACMT